MGGGRVAGGAYWSFACPSCKTVDYANYSYLSRVQGFTHPADQCQYELVCMGQLWVRVCQGLAWYRSQVETVSGSNRSYIRIIRYTHPKCAVRTVSAIWSVLTVQGLRENPSYLGEKFSSRYDLYWRALLNKGAMIKDVFSYFNESGMLVTKWPKYRSTRVPCLWCDCDCDCVCVFVFYRIRDRRLTFRVCHIGLMISIIARVTFCGRGFLENDRTISNDSIEYLW